MNALLLVLATTFVFPKEHGRLVGFAFGNGHYVKEPGAFSILANGHNNATSYNGFEFADGTAFVVGAEAPIMRVWHDPKTGEVGLETDEERPFRVVGGEDVFSAAFEYRRRYPRVAAAGVAAKAGKFCVDVWNGTYREQAEFVRRAATELGITNDVFLCTHVWQRYGYDNHLPDVYPPDPTFGTTEEMKELARTCRRYGWGFGVHHNVVDFYTNATAFAWKDIARDAKGDPMCAWRNVYRQVQSYRMMPEAAPEYMARSLGEMNADGFSPDMVFVDVIGSGPAKPYWRPDGSFVTPAEARRHIGNVFDTIRCLQTAACGRPAFTASEAVHDYLIGHLDGGDCQWMEVTRDEGEYHWNVIPEYADAEKIPWFDAVNHAVFSLHGAGYSIRYEAGRGELDHGIDSDDYLSAEVMSGHALMTDCHSRDVKDVLSGTVRHLDMDRCLEQLRRKWSAAQAVAKELATAEMTAHEFVGGDIHRQKIAWSTGMTVYVNRGEPDWTVDGATLPQYGWLAVNPRTGLRREVSRERPRAKMYPPRYLDITPEEVVRNPGRYELHFWLARRKPTENSWDYYDRLLSSPDETPADAPTGVTLDRLVTVTDKGADPYDVTARYYLKGTPSFFRRFYLPEEPDTYELPVTGVAWGCGANTDPDFAIPHLFIVFADAEGRERREHVCDIVWMGTHIQTGKVPRGYRFVRTELTGGKPETNAKIKVGPIRVFREEFRPLQVELTPHEKLPFPVRTVGKDDHTEVIEIRASAGEMTEVALPAVTNARVVRSFAVPYLTFGERKDRALVDLLDDGTFRFAYFDWTASNASRVDCVATTEGRTHVAKYLPRTDGTYNPVRERIIVRRSRNLEDVLPDIPNPPSPWRRVTGTRVWRSHASFDRADDIALWRAVKAAGMTEVAVTDHETMWRDNGEPFTFCTEAANGKGGDAAEREYSRVMREELGFRYGPYNNFTDIASASPYFTRDRVGRRADGSFQTAWMRCYGPKPSIAPGAAREFTPILKGKFGFDCAYCDVHTSQLPWYRTDYDWRVPGGATYAAVFFAWGEALLAQRELIGGPVWSEGSHQFMWAGLVDGSYGQDRGYDFAREPWIVDFDLLKMHPLNCDFGMGSLSMFSPPTSELERHYYLPGAPKGRDHLIARFIAATLAFGHSGYLVLDRCWEPAKPFGPAYGLKCEAVWKRDGLPAEAFRSYFMVQAIAARYTQTEVESIRYADAAGNLLATSDAIRAGTVGRNQIVVTYRDGTVVVVNGNETEKMRVTVGGREVALGPIGYRAWSEGVEVYSAVEGGRRVNRCTSPRYDYFETEGAKPEVVLKGMKK